MSAYGETPEEAWAKHYRHVQRFNVSEVMAWIFNNHFWSSGKVWTDTFKRHVQIYNGIKVLEAGCGSAKISFRLALEGCDVTCLDYSDYALRLAKDLLGVIESKIGRKLAVHFVRGNLKSLPFPDGTFDLTFNEGVIEHYFDQQEQLQLVREMSRVTKLGGKVFVWVPNKSCLFYSFWRKSGWPGVVVEEYPLRADELESILEKAGLVNPQVIGMEAEKAPFVWPPVLRYFKVLSIPLKFFKVILPPRWKATIELRFAREILGVGTKR